MSTNCHLLNIRPFNDLTLHWLSFLNQRSHAAVIGTCRTFANFLGTSTKIKGMHKHVGQVRPDSKAQEIQALIIKRKVDGGKALSTDLERYKELKRNELNGANIRRLELYGTDSFNFERLENFPNLESLSLSGSLDIRIVTVEMLQKLSEWCPNLQSLNIGCFPFKDAHLAAIKGLTNLRDLKLHNYIITTSGFETIASHFPQLRVLNLSRCENFTDKALQKIAQAHPELQHLDVSGCDKLTDVGIKALSEHCKKLEVLDLNSDFTSHRIIRDEAIVNIAKSCPNLLRLNLAGSMVKDQALFAIAANLKQLQSLDLSYCRNFTNMGIWAVICECTQMQSLSLNRCSQITDKGLELLSEFPQLHVTLPNGNFIFGKPKKKEAVSSTPEKIVPFASDKDQRPKKQLDEDDILITFENETPLDPTSSSKAPAKKRSQQEGLTPLKKIEQTVSQKKVSDLSDRRIARLITTAAVGAYSYLRDKWAAR